MESDVEGPGALVPMVSQVLVDPAGDRVLSTATGAVEAALTVVREPGTGRLVLAAGAHVAHHELIETRGQESLDAGYRARFRGSADKNDGVPARMSYTSGFRLVR